jgi:hypothetical protein
MSSLLADLAGLAWKWCRGDIIAVYNMWAGGMIFAVVYVIFTGMRYLNLTSTLSSAVLGQELGIGGVIMYEAGLGGWVDAIFWLTVIAILVCIFEYFLNLSIVLYYYDECSWKWVQAIRFGFTAIANFGKQARDANASESRKAKFILKSEILKIKNNNRVL